MAQPNMSTGTLPPIEKLLGRENYSTWQFAMKTYLEHEDLWGCVMGSETDETKVRRTRAKIILSVDPSIYVHVQDTVNAKHAWDKLREVYEDSGLSRKVGLLRTLVTTRLENCSSVEEYVTKIISTSHKLNGMSFEVRDEWVGTLLLAGLPDEFKPMIMGIENSNTPITGDSIKTKLLQEVKDDVCRRSPTSDTALQVKRKNLRKETNVSKGPRCYNCNKYGHFAKDCRSKAKLKTTTQDTKKATDTTFFTALTTGKITSTDWYIDSGASAHMSNYPCEKSSSKVLDNAQVTVANNENMSIEAIGSTNINVLNNDMERNIKLTDVLYVPKLNANLLSVSRIIQKGHSITFDNRGCRIRDAKRKVVATAKLTNGMYKLNQLSAEAKLASTINTSNQWHKRLGHLHSKAMKALERGLATGIKLIGEVDSPCVTCLEGKQTRLPFPRSNTKTKGILELIHSDLCGPMETQSIGGAKYFFTLIDDYSRRIFIYTLESKDQVPERFRNFKRLVENQTGKRIRILRTDNGKEYVNTRLTNFLKEEGIKHQTTVPHTPEQNGVAERYNRTIVEKARCLLFEAKLPKKFWGEAVSTAVYLLNRSPTKALHNMTPEEAWSGRKPDLRHLRIFGSKAHVHIPKALRHKWDKKSAECILVGYCEDSKAYRLYEPTHQRVIKRRDVIFNEDPMNCNQNQEGLIKTDNLRNLQEQKPEFLPITEVPVQETSSDTISDESDSEGDDYYSPESIEDEHEDIPPQSEQLPRRSSRPPKPKRMDEFITYSVEELSVSDPSSIEEALHCKDSEKWLEAIQDELRSHQENNTWETAVLPPNRKAINAKWIFKTKRNANGEIVRYKARLVVKGCTQKKGLEYEETYAPVIRYNSLRYLFGLAARYDLDIDHLDVVTAFLQGDINEEIYVKIPVINQDIKAVKQETIYKLKKAVYGLKQGSRCWNLKLDRVLTNLNFKRSTADPCVYQRNQGENILIIAIYVDDILIFSNNQKQKNDIKEKLKKEFKLKDLGEVTNCLGIRITRDRQRGLLWMDQSQYIDQVLNKFNMKDCNPSSTPLDKNQILTHEMSPKTKKEEEVMRNVPYREAIGCMMYAQLATRPDLAYGISVVSRFSNNPGVAHWQAVKRILRYLKGTKDMKLCFSNKDSNSIIGYSDADWAGDSEDRKSTTGYLFMTQGGAISWNSKKQPTVALSTTEAEYMALTSASQEALWLRRLMREISPAPKEGAIELMCDNKGAIDLSATSGYKPRTKHIDTKHHFIREKIESAQISVKYISTDLMLADVMTKALAKPRHYQLISKFGLCPPMNTNSSGSVEN